MVIHGHRVTMVWSVSGLVGKRSVSTQLQQTVGMRKDSCKNTPRQEIPVKVLQQKKSETGETGDKKPLEAGNSPKSSAPARSTTSAGRCQTWVYCLSSKKPTSDIIGGQLISQVKRLWEWDFWVCVCLFFCCCCCCCCSCCYCCCCWWWWWFSASHLKQRHSSPPKKARDAWNVEIPVLLRINLVSKSMVIQNYLTLKHSKTISLHFKKSQVQNIIS